MSFGSRVRIMGSFSDPFVGLLGCPQYFSGVSQILIFKSINILPVLLLQSPTFASIECYREYRSLHDSDFCKQHFIGLCV